MNDTHIVTKIDVRSPAECWEWLGSRIPKGYGRTSIGGRAYYSHRAVYELFVGPIPEGLQLDHLCRNRACVNPDHLEPVTARENFLRGESPGAIIANTGLCPRGHSMDNPVITNKAKGWRSCRTCWNEGVRRRRRAAP